jgi:GrpB-like predicted nucleotidyltransferase (UPF0157 family)
MIPEDVRERVDRVSRELVEIKPYDPRWPALFVEERDRLMTWFPTLIRRIEHFGSTAVPGLSAKPIVDMLAEVTSLDAARTRIAPELQRAGYDYFWRPSEGDDAPPFYAWFIRRDASGQRTHHIHMVESSFPQWESLLFRDYLIAQPAVAAEYEILKRRLAAEFPHDREAYTSGKGDFIRRITSTAGSTGADGVSKPLSRPDEL